MFNLLAFQQVIVFLLTLVSFFFFKKRNRKAFNTYLGIEFIAVIERNIAVKVPAHYIESLDRPFVEI